MLRCDFSRYDLPADVYADALVGVDDLGGNFRSVFATFARSDNGVLVPVPVLCVVRPKTSILVKDGAISKLLAMSRHPVRDNEEGGRLHS